MTRARVQKWGTNAYVEIDTAATIGAMVGKDLRWSDGTVITEDELRAVSQVPDTGQDFTYWRLIQEIPLNVVAVAELASAGFVRRGSGGAWTAAPISNPDLSNATTSGLAEGDNLYFTDDRVRAVAGTVIRRAAGALGGHRIVRSAGVDLVGYASAADPTHGDDTLGITTGAAGDGLEVMVRTRGPVHFDGWSWIPLEPLYLAIDGGITQTPPEPPDGAAFLQVVGHAESSTTAFINAQPPIYF